MRFEDPDVQQQYKNGKLWEQLVHWDEEGYVMSCSTPGEDIYTETGDKPMKVSLLVGRLFSRVTPFSLCVVCA